MTAGFQCWATPWGDLFCDDGIVMQPATGVRFATGAGGLFAEAAPGPARNGLIGFPTAPGATFLGGSGRNLILTGLTKDPSGPAVPCGVFQAAEPDTYRLANFTIVKTGASAATVHDGTATVAILSAGGTAPAGSYAATAYGKTTYASGADFTLAAAAETGTPLGLPGATSFPSAGTAPAGAWTAVTPASWALAADASWTLAIDASGSAEIRHSGTAMATRPAGGAWSPEGRFEATAAGKTGYNSGADFTIHVAVSQLSPRAGYVYLTLTEVAGVLTSASGPFFGALPTPGGSSCHVPLAQSDGAGGMEQFHTGALVWQPAASPPTALARVGAFKSTDQTIAAGVYSKVTFDTEEYDPLGAFSGSTFTAPAEGHVLVCAGIYKSGVTSIDAWGVYKNGTQHKRVFSGPMATQEQSSGSVMVAVVAGDTLEIYYYTGNGGTLLGAATITWVTFDQLPTLA